MGPLRNASKPKAAEPDLSNNVSAAGTTHIHGVKCRKDTRSNTQKDCTRQTLQDTHTDLSLPLPAPTLSRRKWNDVAPFCNADERMRTRTQPSAANGARKIPETRTHADRSEAHADREARSAAHKHRIDASQQDAVRSKLPELMRASKASAGTDESTSEANPNTEVTVLDSPIARQITA